MHEPCKEMKVSSSMSGSSLRKTSSPSTDQGPAQGDVRAGGDVCCYPNHLVGVDTGRSAAERVWHTYDS